MVSLDILLKIKEIRNFVGNKNFKKNIIAYFNKD